MRRLSDFSEVVLLDFEYHFGKGWRFGGHPVPVCACAYELRSKRTLRLWANELPLHKPPWAHGRDVLLVSFNAIAELSCYLALQYPLPPFVLDLLYEYRQWMNGVLYKGLPRDLDSVMNRHQLPWNSRFDKKAMHELILRAGPYSAQEQVDILDYCWEDVHALELLLPFMLPHLPVDLDLCLYRGRYALPAAVTQATGIPIDEPLWNQFLEMRKEIQLEVIAGHPVYSGITFDRDEFARWLTAQHVTGWPRTATGQPSVAKDTFRSFAGNKAVEELRQIRSVVEQLRKPSIQVRQGRTWFGILPFKAESSRNATTHCIFQSPSWMRGLIQPRPGTGLILADYSQEEYYIAGYRSGDPEMLRLYREGDPYIAFGIWTGLMPPDATKQTHARMRDIVKTVSLAVMYGQGTRSMARKLGITVNRAENLLREHQARHPVVWRWFRRQVDSSYGHREAVTLMGWRLYAGASFTRAGTLKNFPVQGSGADILRLAHLLLFEAGICVCAPVHDAFLVQADEKDLEETKAQVIAIMERASRIVLGKDSILRASATVLRYPQRLIEPKGKDVWDQIIATVNRKDVIVSPDLRSNGKIQCKQSR